MKKGGRSGHLKRNVILTALLALLCIGAAELTFCRYFEPELYDRIVAPARYTATVVADAGRAGLNATGRFFRSAGNAAVQFFQSVGSAVSDFAVRTGEQAAAMWEDLTAPKTTPEPPEAARTPAPTAAPTVPPTPPPVTELLEEEGRQILTGGIVDVTYFCQSDDEWKDQPYGTDTIGPYGCGPTVMAIAVASLTDTETTPPSWRPGRWSTATGPAAPALTTP